MTLDRDRINALMGIPNPELKSRVEAKIEETIVKLNGWDIPVKRPKVLYDLKGHTAGYAIGGHTIRLNLQLLADKRYTEDMIEQTIPHEVAHIAVHQNWPKAKGHGREWQSLMFKLGLNAKRCHQYETVAARKKKAKPYTLYCDCGPHKVSATIMRRYNEGRNYRCRRCGKILVTSPKSS